MARRIPAAVNGTNGDAPPPSTLAAQIVQKQTRQDAGPPRLGEDATFAQLLHEILHNRGTAPPETNVAVNAQLINVVAEAGLAVLTQNDPFAEWELLIPQAVDSIRVIEATIKQQPEVLKLPVSEGGPQLSVWLIAKLVAVCGRPKCFDLPLVELLDSMLRTLTDSLDFRQHAQDLQLVLKDCVDDAITLLESETSLTGGITLQLPTARSIAKLWPESEGAIVMPQGCQATISTAIQAMAVAATLSSVNSFPRPWVDEASLRLACLLNKQLSTPEKNPGREHTLRQLLNSRSLQARVKTVRYALQMTLVDPSTTKLIHVDLSQALMDILHFGKHVEHYSILPDVMTIRGFEGFRDLDAGLQDAINLWFSRFNSREDMLASREEFPEPRARKRRRLDYGFGKPPQISPLQQITDLLNGGKLDDVATLPKMVARLYKTADEETQCRVWRTLVILVETDLGVAAAIVTKLVQLQETKKNKKARTLSMLAIRACVLQSQEVSLTDLAISELGQHCLRSVQSSVRETRISAVRCLPAFLRADLPQDIKDQNRKVVLEYLRSLVARDIVNEHETVITAWGQVALTCEGQELNLALLSLTEFLGHTNPLICGLAFTELESISEIKMTTIEDLLKPFWRTIAVAVVQDLHTRPQKAQQLCDLLATDINTFLLNTQQETVPNLVLTKKNDILERIATARGNGATLQDIILQPKTNLVATLALLLRQPSRDVEEAVMDCLANIAPGFASSDLGALVKIEPTLIACELLMFAASEDESRKSRAYQAFQAFANLAEREAGKKKAHANAARTVADFFENHILGILIQYTIVLEDISAIHPTSEKIACLGGITAMITMAKGITTIALPQLKACLQSGIDRPELCEAAFGAWLNLITVLEADDITSMIDQTFALLLQHWHNFSDSMQRQIHDTIGVIVREYNTVIRENIATLPALMGIPMLSKFAAEFERLKALESLESQCIAFVARILDESSSVALQGLKELQIFLEKQQDSILNLATSEQPGEVLSNLVRALLDTTARFAHTHFDAAVTCAKCLGALGCLDPNSTDAPKKTRHVLMLSNFEKAGEVVEWVCVLLEQVFVNAFRSVSNARAQGFLAYVIQELLRFCGFNDASTLRLRASQGHPAVQRWMEMPERIRITLTPFLNSRYNITRNAILAPRNRSYPGFLPDSGYNSWLRGLVFDLMWKGKGDNPKMVFPLLAKTIKGHDLAIAEALLPYALLNVILGGTVVEVRGIREEMLAVLRCEATNTAQSETVRLCSDRLFTVLDFLSAWIQEKRKNLSEIRAAAYKTGHSPVDFDEIQDMSQIETLENYLSSIPAEVIAARAVDCGSYARALFHWEKYIRQKRPIIPSPNLSDDEGVLYERLQEIYAQIDEPDGLEGISAHLSFVSEEQQAIQHARAGRWTAAQAWYEVQLHENAEPSNPETRMNLLGCLRETGQYSALLRYTDSFMSQSKTEPYALLPLATEAAWMASDFEKLGSLVQVASDYDGQEFNVNFARLLSAHRAGDVISFEQNLDTMRRYIAQSLAVGARNITPAHHQDLRNLHVLHEAETLARCMGNEAMTSELFKIYDKRLDAMGSRISDKQFVLGARRAMTQLSSAPFMETQTGSAWLKTARLARKAGNTATAYNAALYAYYFGDRSAKLEEARLLWRDGHRRQAIQELEAAISSGIFDSPEPGNANQDSTLDSNNQDNMLSARAHLLLAKWIDASGQSKSGDMIVRFQYAARTFQRWEKGHYYLGKHYVKMLDAEKAQPKARQQATLHTGELTRLCVENLLRSVPFGNKYWHQSIPKVLTLWLDLGMDCLSRAPKEDQATFEKRVKNLQACNKHFAKYFERVPAYVYWSAMPQIISRISHQHPEVWKQLQHILVRLGTWYPNQALWSLLAIVKATDKLRAERGMEIINKLKDPKSKSRATGGNIDLRTMILQGQRLSDGLLHASETSVEPRASKASLSKDLGFNHKLAPNPLVVPVEATLVPNVPQVANPERIRKHQAFAQEKITIQSFQDDVLVLSSLQRPRKVTIRGSDGKSYGLLCKPKDDLRKDQRLMEFNSQINRALKRDEESSKRRLYIKTYAVTPLSEESGVLEWVDGIKPIRDILLNIYARRGVKPNYNDLRSQLNEACASPEHAHMFEDKVLSIFKPVLYEWFMETYADPETWFAARLRYARSAAVTSITGHVLGLGDRHGENILLQEGTGGVFHVDFNCLFDKGLSFDKPEVVPFRLTHNMVDAMGPYGYDGPYRKSCELTYSLLRQNKDTLMTILETFLYDPTTDFVGKKKRATAGVPDTPQEVLDNVSGKLEGLLKGESVPLSVEGYVDALILEAVTHWNLCRMYIGWCAFL